jgi:hypothetical protein
MKRCGPWLFVGFVLAILLPGLHPVRPTLVFLDSPIGRASRLDVSRLFVPAVAVMVPAVQPAKFWLPPEARRSRAGPDQCLPLLSNFSLNHAPLRADDTGPPWIDLRGPQCWFERLPRLKLQGPPGPPVGLRRGELPVRTCENRGSARIGVLQRVIFTTGFS